MCVQRYRYFSGISFFVLTLLILFLFGRIQKTESRLIFLIIEKTVENIVLSFSLHLGIEEGHVYGRWDGAGPFDRRKENFTNPIFSRKFPLRTDKMEWQVVPFVCYFLKKKKENFPCVG